MYVKTYKEEIELIISIKHQVTGGKSHIIGIIVFERPRRLGGRAGINYAYHRA